MDILVHTHLAQEFPEPFLSLVQKFSFHRWTILEDNQRPSVDALSSAQVYIGGPLDEQSYTQATNLKLHVLPYTGVNGFPFALLKQRSIALANNHGNAPAVAERALALALGVSGRLVEFHNDLACGNWHRNPPPQPLFDLWTSLVGARVSILGTGAIGTTFAQLISGFGAEIIGWRKNVSLGIPKGFSGLSPDLESALRNKDLILVALPLTSQTKGLLGAQELEWARGSIVVNVSRGSILQEKALYEALENRTLRGAGIDAWYQYPSPPWSSSSPSVYDFASLPQVVLSPHAGSHTTHGKLGQWTHTLEQIEHYLVTGTVTSLVNLDQEY